MPGQWTAEQWLQWFKEIVTALIGLAIIVYTLYMTSVTLGMIGDAGKLPGAKDLLLLFLSLAGVVLGYYFGRVPADARSAQAQQQAMNATTQTAQIGARAELMSQQLGITMEKIMSTSNSTMNKDTAEELERIRKQLHDLSDMARMR